METINCDLCGCSNATYLFSERGYLLQRCRECGMLYVNPRPSVEEQSKWVEEGRTAGQSPITLTDHYSDNSRRLQSYYCHVLNLLEPSRVPGAILLDMGCATGGLMAAAVARGWQAAGIEPNLTRAELAKAHGRIYRSIEEVPRNLTAITLVNVFSHLRSPRAFFQQAAETLSPGGRLYLKTGELGRIRKSLLRDWEIPDHLFFAGLGCVEKYLDEAGLTVVEKRRTDPVAEQFSEESLEMRGRSFPAYVVKRVISMTPGVRAALIMGLRIWRFGAEVYSIEVVAEKAC